LNDCSFNESYGVVRTYRQARRGETADETRRRIVQATFDLHSEQGIAATTMKQIAERAEVSVGSVYHHFPTYDDAINACGAHAFSLFPLPTADIFEDAETRVERVRRLARAMFRLFANLPIHRVIADQEKLPVLTRYVAQEQDARLALAVDAAGDADARTLAALVDSATYDAFARLGFSTEAAADQAAAVANAWLDTRQET
jgi:AcrR family transcriptional regulator